jgi:protein-L-isoaspartate(D-aspartate) O-methyltransferase
MNYELARHHMIQQQLRTAEVLSAPVVDLLYTDRREAYVPAAHRALAFADTALPVGQGDATLLTPKLEARLLQSMNLTRTDRVLEIGAGSGHMAALMAEQAQQVWTVEIDPAVATLARANLDGDGVVNVNVEVGNGLTGLADHAPYDCILLSGGVTEIPAELLAQLKVGGRLFAFVTLPGQSPLMALRRVEHPADDLFVTTDLMETVVPMLTDAAPARRFVF